MLHQIDFHHSKYLKNFTHSNHNATFQCQKKKLVDLILEEARVDEGLHAPKIKTKGSQSSLFLS